jgi:hypothetical protein
MAISQRNVITHGLSGKIGDLLVFRNQNGKTIVGKVPVRSTVAPTAKQEAVKDRFKLASKFAKQAMLDDTLLSFYRAASKKGQRPFNAAFSDFFVAPTISNPIGVYAGQIGDLLSVNAIDNFEVKEVTLQIYQADGTLIEQGNALLQIDGVKWSYTVKSNFASLAGCKLLWSAADWAGNATELEIEIT